MALTNYSMLGRRVGWAEVRLQIEPLSLMRGAWAPVAAQTTAT